MTAAIVIGAVLAGALLLTLGIYLGHRFGRQKRAELAAEVAELRRGRDVWKQIAEARRHLLNITSSTHRSVYDHAKEGL